MDVDSVNRLRVVIGRLARNLNASATREGLTPTQASILGFAVKLGPVGLPQLLEIEGIHPTMLSRVVGRLDELGLIKRMPDPADARGVLVKGTRRGAATHSRIKAERAAAVSECVDSLGKERADILLEALPVLEALAEALRKSAA